MESIVATTRIKSSPDKFYKFFKYTMNDLVKVVPLIFTSVEIIEGVEGQVGCVKLWKYTLGGISLSAKEKLTALDDAGLSITYTVVEGDLLILYKSFTFTLAFSDGVAKCTYAYQKATLLSPPPQAYVALAITVFTVLDAIFSSAKTLHLSKI